ncbi:hypothetical protein FEQ05_04245 [Burkholderia pseudomultivorans]|uniref:Uncharacterized protein n=1 Tax=Burkholderia pseudomultivorans TaxID=1207504 RepID=A0A6P2L128_9BURK|nr:hypothetical protein [Burkholderia pseudomultivorans]MDR8737898.1 hypothetical protein [Burkholderia pseudomultivorans]MDR8744227.1 hypothetical protein [Burkholderia pseudomultivorans]MDR8755907.1 hypothetical protein [Burkholderia pseudomultivorans]MDR8780616.1 hypothetical protein [Burkholderia pseudomultivorans]
MLVKDNLGEFNAHWVTWLLVKGSWPFFQRSAMLAGSELA